jgi:hypothetical protein
VDPRLYVVPAPMNKYPDQQQRKQRKSQ